MTKFSLKRRVLIVGEGKETEYNYFVGFRNAFARELETTATSVKVARGRGGDACRIVDNAIKEAKKFNPSRRHGDRVVLLLDTEGPGSMAGRVRKPELRSAENLARKNDIEIFYSCPAFEYWLLCHFENISRAQFKDCNAVIVDLDKEKRWKSVCNTQYEKSDKDVFDRLSQRLDVARDQALEIDLHHRRLRAATPRANPSTQVYELIATLIGVRTGKKCPIKGTWKLLGNPGVAIQRNKGDIMPSHDGSSANWQL